MADFRIKTSWRRHPKRIKLRHRLGPDAVIALEDLWSFCADERPVTASLVGMTNEDIAIACDWPVTRADEFIRTLLELRLLVEVAGGYAVNDWFDHQPWLVEDETRRNQGRMNALLRWHKEGKHKGLPHAECAECLKIKPPQKGQVATPDGPPMAPHVGPQWGPNAPIRSQPNPTDPSKQPHAGLHDGLTEAAVIEAVEWETDLTTACSAPRREKLRTLVAEWPVTRELLDSALARTKARGGKSLGAVVDELLDMRKEGDLVPSYHGPPDQEPLPPVDDSPEAERAAAEAFALARSLGDEPE